MTEQRSELAPRYAAGEVEPRIYERWLASGAFTPPPDPPPGAERFVVIQPPPNVTGSLHMGHALTATVEDILVRYHRMRGDDTLWLPGADHAGIAAQFVLDRILAQEGESRASLGRERYLERMWAFIDETRPVIGMQHRRLGASVDWSRERFTMDATSARAVRVAFTRLHQAGLVYRGEALVNWCPRCQTTISDLENVHHEETGTLWTIRYHLAGPDGAPDPATWISVATTRPETILGDTAVAVHPDDERYRGLVGRDAILPFLGRRIPIIADDVVQPEFGTGAVKITPAHDPDDYATGRRHGLPMISVLDEQARVTEAGGEFAGLDRFAARAAIVERLREMGDLEAERRHPMAVGRCDRCGTVVEPRLSVQWFIRAAPLAERALASVREGRTRILPVHYAKVYTHWLENIHDWAVGRQLWWGHRIPAWYCPDGHITVSDAEGGPGACSTCGRPAAELTQETDIFDTWFSSGLWPFSTLGWPDDTPDMRRFYPTSVMETGYDIIFFWVARMMMLGLFCTDVEPFHTVYLHGLIRLEGGSKMSKTKGNVVDPLEVIDEIGADALRFALVSGTAAGTDQRLTDAKLAGGRNFTNKLWNAARYVLGARPASLPASEGEPRLAERWMASRMTDALDRGTRHLDELDLAGYAGVVHEVAWSDFCDWFIEMTKVDLRRPGASEGERARAWRSAATGLATLLRLLHPLMPFVTETIWATLTEAAPEVTDGEPLLATARWPAPLARDLEAEDGFSKVMELTQEYREQRNVLDLPVGDVIPATVHPGSQQDYDLVSREREYIETLSRIRPLKVVEPGGSATYPMHASNSRVGVAWLNAPDKGINRRTGAESELRERIDRLRALLAGPFSTRAPAELVERERERLADLETQLRLLAAE